MQQVNKKFAITDPRTFDGNSYEVATRASQQLHGLVSLAAEAFDPAYLMVRNAYLQRQIDFGETPDEEAWQASVECKHWLATKADLEKSAKRLAALSKAAGYNPRARH